MLQTGEYTTYKEFGLDLIECLELNGYSDALKNDNFPKLRTLTTPQEIDLIFYGYKSKNTSTQRRLGRFSYDCLIRYKGEDVSFETICREIIEKCYQEEISVLLSKNIVYIFLKSLSIRPLTTANSIFGNYLLVDDELIRSARPIRKNGIFLSEEELYRGEQNMAELIAILNDKGRFSFQEMVNIISYIAIIEEFNYPSIGRNQNYRGRSDCFGRYVEVLFGNEAELNYLLQTNSFSEGANFVHDDRYKDYYLTNLIESDRIELREGEYF